MFDTPTEARMVLQEHFGKPQVEMLVEALVPAILFVPVPGGRIAVGGTRLGGSPDLPPGIDWPRRAKPANAEEIAGRGSKEAGEGMRRHFGLELPYAFFAQVDLSQAAALGPVAGALPGEGRLLFFYDVISGPYDTGTETVRVIWDASPRESLTIQATPPALKAAAEDHRKAVADGLTASGIEKPADWKDAGTPYGGPARAMTLKAVLRLPDPHAIEMEDRKALKALWERDLFGSNAFRDAYDDVLARYFDPHFGPKNAGHHNQMLGSAVPEQDDPRLDAVVVSEFGVQHLGSDQWKARYPEIKAKAKAWRLLLQVDVADVLQETGEGTVYFLIRDEDLAQRRFERVVAVYQQT